MTSPSTLPDMAYAPTPLAARSSRNRALVRSLAERGTLWSQSRRRGIAGMFASVAARLRGRRDREESYSAGRRAAEALYWTQQQLSTGFHGYRPQPEAPEGTPASTCGERQDRENAYRILRQLGWERKTARNPLCDPQEVVIFAHGLEGAKEIVRMRYKVARIVSVEEVPMGKEEG